MHKTNAVLIICILFTTDISYSQHQVQAVLPLVAQARRWVYLIKRILCISNDNISIKFLSCLSDLLILIWSQPTTTPSQLPSTSPSKSPSVSPSRSPSKSPSAEVSCFCCSSILSLDFLRIPQHHNYSHMILSPALYLYCSRHLAPR